jgi:hypothetical protein
VLKNDFGGVKRGREPPLEIFLPLPLVKGKGIKGIKGDRVY